ncbi:MAG: hypothetical protein U9O96_05170 [Candidatus Thermoplasmatota archaeon]|nr:hypothetical protein [Candidatus Thermoplasmatota archaeon]
MSEIDSKFMEKVPAGFFAIVGRKVLLLNEYMAGLAGFSEKEISEERFWKLVHDDVDKVRKKIIHGIPVRFKFGKKDREMWVEYRGATSYYKDERAIFGCIVEVTSHMIFDKKMRGVEKVSREMKVASSREKVYDLVMNFTKDNLGYQNCAILERSNNHLKIVKERGYDEGTRALKLPLEGKGITVYAFNKNEAQYVPDVLKAEGYIEGVPGARCEYAVPITFKKKNTGYLMFKMMKSIRFPMPTEFYSTLLYLR